MPCEYGGLAQKLIDGVWIEIPCDPSTQRVCWTHKMEHWRDDGANIDIPDRFKQEVTQRELATDIFARAKATGDELQRAS